jgi:hypothetical protein
VNVFFFVLQAAFAALNAALYVNSGSPLSLGAAIFCGLGSLFSLVMAAVES